MAAVPRAPEDDRALLAHLRPPVEAVRACAAARVVVVHHALPDAGVPFGDTGPDLGDDTAGFVAGDHVQRFRGAIDPKVGAAHPRRLDLQDDFTRTRRRLRDVGNVQLAIPEKIHCPHGVPPACTVVTGRRVAASTSSNCIVLAARIRLSAIALPDTSSEQFVATGTNVAPESLSHLIQPSGSGPSRCRCRCRPRSGCDALTRR